jgi:hypothetical protein
MARRDYVKGALPYTFVGIPKDVLAMTEFQALPSAAKALMLDLMAQYTGKNNGRLCPSWECMQHCGWASKGTLARAKAALLEAPFAVLTRKGHAPRTADWIGFTWWQLHFHQSMDIEPQKFPYLNFQRMALPDPNSGRDSARKTEAVVPKQDRYPAKPGLRGTKTGPQEASQ